jgi:hypothetical protein
VFAGRAPRGAREQRRRAVRAAARARAQRAPRRARRRSAGRRMLARMSWVFMFVLIKLT